MRKIENNEFKKFKSLFSFILLFMNLIELTVIYGQKFIKSENSQPSPIIRQSRTRAKLRN